MTTVGQALAEVVYETLVIPAMEYFPDFTMNPRGYIHEPGSISSQLVEELLSAELVIADLTDLSPSGYFELGAERSAGRGRTAPIGPRP